MRPVKPGDPIGRHLTARTFNNLTKRPQNKTYIPPQRDIPNSTMVRVTGSSTDVYKPVSLLRPNPIVEPIPTEVNDPFYTYPQFLIRPYGQLSGVVGILQDPLEPLTSARAVIKGLTWASIYVPSDSNGFFWVGIEDDPDSGLGGQRLTLRNGPSIGRVVWGPWNSGPGSTKLDDYNLCLIDLTNSSAGQGIVGQVSSFGSIPACDGNTPGQGSVSIQEYDPATNQLSPQSPQRYLTVLNLHTFVIPNNSYVVCKFDETLDEWLVEHPGIVDLRVDGYRLQYKMSHGDWVTWHVGADCDETNPAGSQYFRTGTTDSYLQPNGTDTYIRP